MIEFSVSYLARCLGWRLYSLYNLQFLRFRTRINLCTTESLCCQICLVTELFTWLKCQEIIVDGDTVLLAIAA